MRTPSKGLFDTVHAGAKALAGVQTLSGPVVVYRGRTGAAGSVEVRLRVPEPPPYLRHEMTVSIDIEAARREQTLMIPASAVRETGGAQPWVMVVRDGRAERQPVRLGIRGAGRVEVLEGVAVGEALVPAAVDVAAGQAVRIRAAP